jgi:hypothetical protein
MLIVIALLLLALSVGADFAFLYSLRRFLAPRKVRLAGSICVAVEFFLVVYLVLLATARETVMPHPDLTLAVLSLLVPKVAFLLLWLCFVRPFSCMRGSLYNFLTALLLSVLLGGVILHGGLRERFLVEVKRVEVASPKVPRSFDGYRIAQISDVHLGSLTEADTTFLRRAVDSILALEPDVVCFTGDLVNIRAAELKPAFMAELKRLRTRRHRVYAVMGNHDYADYDHSLTDSLRAADADSLRALIADLGWTLLDNRGEYIRHRAYCRPGEFISPMESLRLLGVGNIGEPPFSTYGDLEAAIASLPTDEPTRMDEQFTILLSHNPTHWRAEVLEYTDIDLTLSGHTHGMQVCVGGFSPAVWRYKEWGGLYQEGDRYLYVNTGLGTVGFPVRIGLKPEVTLITLRHTEPLTDEDLEVY